MDRLLNFGKTEIKAAECLPRRAGSLAALVVDAPSAVPGFASAVG
jgi:hypothetical protein